MTGISRASYYRWRAPPPSIPVEMELRDGMQQVALEFPAYGYRRITRELNRRGFAVNHKRVLRLMRQDNLLCLRRKSFVATTDSRHNLPVYPNLAGAITPAGVNQLWRADITYIRLRAEFVYLAGGIRYAAGRSSLYTVVQAPVYTHVNETQLAPSWGLLIGVSRTF
jgi:hypothetical protein